MYHSKGITLCFVIVRDSQNLPKQPLCPDLQQRQSLSTKQQQSVKQQQQRKRIVWKQTDPKEKQRKPTGNENVAKSQPSKSDVRSKVENTRSADSSKLSTILEATEVKILFNLFNMSL